MNTLKLRLEYCYGIKKLEHDFDFSKFRTNVIYASNGVMKTSFAKTFYDLSIGKDPKDLITDEVTPVFEVLCDGISQINKEALYVIESYNDKIIGSEGKILTLLADESLKSIYLEVYDELEGAKISIVKALKVVSKSTDCEKELLEVFSVVDKSNLFEIFEKNLQSVKSSEEVFNFKYNDIFDPKGKVREFLSENGSLFEEYCNKYDSLLSASDFFSKNTGSIFGTTEARDLKKAIRGNEFFTAGHTLSLKNGGDIRSKDEFNEILDREIIKIFNNEDLKKLFDKLDKKLDANEELKTFKKVIESDKSILVRLRDYGLFRREVWFSYLKQLLPEVENATVLYRQKRPILEGVFKAAREQKSAWEGAIEEFHSRFVGLPFRLVIDNKVEAILKSDVPAISFKFLDKMVDRSALLNILSQGEKRALYLLNIIFEIHARKIANQKTLFIIDDIADSFDYKNKYAIIEYLNDLTNDPNFYSIILTHNFDFFRTLQSRILTERFKRSHSFIAEKSKEKVLLVGAGSKDATNPFATWKDGVNNNEKYLIACIPFVRNLIEFKNNSGCDEFKLLTHVLHYKKADFPIKSTLNIGIEDLEALFHDVLGGTPFSFPDKTKKVVKILEEQITNILDTHQVGTIALENKIILAIGIRLKAERYMWGKVTDKTIISGSQTGRLLQRYKDEFGQDQAYRDIVRLLESVNIMTPENIHLNSFMYEPILDMGLDELKDLYSKVSHLESDLDFS